MDLIIHIGTEKTGTTSIQNGLHANRDALTQAGIYLPVSLGGHNPRQLATYAMKDGRPDDVFPNGPPSRSEKKVLDQEIYSRFIDEIDHLPETIHTVIISCEQFHSRLIYKEEVLKLRELFEGRFSNIRVVVYLRPQAALAASLYTTALWYRSILTFDEFIYKHQQKNPKYYDYQEMLERWASVFGFENMTVRRFIRSEFPEGDVVKDFIQHGMLRPDLTHGFSSVVSSNESLSVIGQKLLRYYNCVSRFFGTGVIEGYFKCLVKNVLVRGFSGRGKTPVEEHIQYFEELYATGNVEVAKSYFSLKNSLFDD